VPAALLTRRRQERRRQTSWNLVAVTAKSVLPNLTAEDLKDLGIATVGHRQKLLDAISAGP